jgi:hypothetical protein
VTRRQLGAVVAVYGATLAAATVLWVVLFHTPLLAGSVFFYRGLLLLALTAALVVAVLGWLARTRLQGLIGVRDILLILTLLVSANVLFFTHVPVTADRSISVFMLAYMDRADGPLTSGEISDTIVNEYVLRRAAVEKRLDEQLVTGTLVRTGDGYELSDKGRWLVDFYQVIARLFNIDPANLSP